MRRERVWGGVGWPVRACWPGRGAAAAASQRQCEEERRSVNERAAEAVAKEHEDRRIEAENSK